MGNDVLDLIDLSLENPESILLVRANEIMAMESESQTTALTRAAATNSHGVIILPYDSLWNVRNRALLWLLGRFDLTPSNPAQYNPRISDGEVAGYPVNLIGASSQTRTHWMIQVSKKIPTFEETLRGEKDAPSHFTDKRKLEILSTTYRNHMIAMAQTVSAFEYVLFVGRLAVQMDRLRQSMQQNANETNRGNNERGFIFDFIAPVFKTAFEVFESMDNPTEFLRDRLIRELEWALLSANEDVYFGRRAYFREQIELFGILSERHNGYNPFTEFYLHTRLRKRVEGLPIIPELILSDPRLARNPLIRDYRESISELLENGTLSEKDLMTSRLYTAQHVDSPSIEFLVIQGPSSTKLIFQQQGNYTRNTKLLQSPDVVAA